MNPTNDVLARLRAELAADTGQSEHSFGRSLAMSQDPVVRAALERVYRRMWPGDLVKQIAYQDDWAFQSQGRDLTVRIRTTRDQADAEMTVMEYMEEKLRSVQQSRYDDLLIETKSNIERNTAGWIFTSRAHWLVYAQHRPLGWLRVLILPMGALRDWFTPRRERFEERQTLPTRVVNGASYHTLNSFVPFNDSEFKAFWHANGCAIFKEPLDP